MDEQLAKQLSGNFDINQKSIEDKIIRQAQQKELQEAMEKDKLIIERQLKGNYTPTEEETK